MISLYTLLRESGDKIEVKCLRSVRLILRND